MRWDGSPSPSEADAGGSIRVQGSSSCPVEGDGIDDSTVMHVGIPSRFGRSASVCGGGCSPPFASCDLASRRGETGEMDDGWETVLDGRKKVGWCAYIQVRRGSYLPPSSFRVHPLWRHLRQNAGLSCGARGTSHLEQSTDRPTSVTFSAALQLCATASSPRIGACRAPSPLQQQPRA